MPRVVKSKQVILEVPLEKRKSVQLATLAVYLDMSVDYLKGEIRDGRLKAHKAGAVWLVKTSDALRWLESLPSSEAQNADLTVANAMV